MKKKILSLFMGAMLGASLLAGCGSGTGSYATADESYSESSYDSNKYSDFDSYDVDYEEVSNEESLTEGENTSSIKELSQKLVYSANVDIETKEYEDSYAKIKEDVEAYEGFIEYENESNNNYSWYTSDSSNEDRYLSIRIRIPSKNYESFMAGLDNYGKVMSKSSNVENITQSYNTLEARIAALKKEEERLLAMMDQATDIEDMIYVEERLAEVESDISVYETNRRGMDLDVQYSTVSIDLEEVREIKPSTRVQETFGYRVKTAFVDGWVNLADGLGDMIVALLQILPSLLVFGLVIFIIVKIVLKVSKKKEAKRAKMGMNGPVPPQPVFYKPGEYPGNVPNPAEPTAPQQQGAPQQPQSTTASQNPTEEKK